MYCSPSDRGRVGSDSPPGTGAQYFRWAPLTSSAASAAIEWMRWSFLEGAALPIRRTNKSATVYSVLSVIWDRVGTALGWRDLSAGHRCSFLNGLWSEAKARSAAPSSIGLPQTQVSLFFCCTRATSALLSTFAVDDQAGAQLRVPISNASVVSGWLPWRASDEDDPGRIRQALRSRKRCVPSVAWRQVPQDVRVPSAEWVGISVVLSSAA